MIPVPASTRVWLAAGVTDTIHAGADVLSTLSDHVQHLGIA